MLAQFITIGILVLFSAMLPGPDFAIVTKNTLLHSRRAGIFTSIGIGSAIIVHMTYCILGLAIVISQSIVLFNTIKYIGAIYLIYLGITTLLSKQSAKPANTTVSRSHKTHLSDLTALRQGFVCNLLNPKATLFFLALFTLIIKPETPLAWELIYGIEIILIAIGWFCLLTMILSHPRVIRLLNHIEHYISKVLGVFLIGFGAALALVKQH